MTARTAVGYIQSHTSQVSNVRNNYNTSNQINPLTTFVVLCRGQWCPWTTSGYTMNPADQRQPVAWLSTFRTDSGSRSLKVKKSKCIAIRRNSATRLRETHMSYGITQCYLPPDRGENPAFTPSRSRYSIERPLRDARLSCPMLRESGPAGNWTATCQSQVQRPTAEQPHNTLTSGAETK